MASSGWRLGDALHNISARARVTASEVTADHVEAVRNKYRTAFMEAGEKEHADVTAGIIAAMGGIDAFPPELHDLLKKAGGPEAQFDWLLQLGLVFASLFFLGGKFLEPNAQKYFNKIWTLTPDVPLSPADAALAVVRGELSAKDGEFYAAQTGYGPDVFAHMTAITGEPPAIQELLFLWRRGKIDTERLVHGVRQSRVRNEWIDAIEALAFAPPSAQQAVAAAVQGHLSLDEARRIVAENGVDPGSFDWLYETAGRPPGPEMLIKLMHRGLMTPGEVEQAIRESDIKNKYIPAIIQAGDYIPPVRSVVAMLRHGAITPDRARVLLRENGVRADDIEGYVGEATKGATQPHRDLTASNLVTAYRDGLASRGDVHGKLVALGYDDAESTLLLDLEDAQQPVALQRQVIATTRAKYVAHHIDESTASGVLDAAHVDAAQRDRLLVAWGLERGENVRQLTPAVLTKGVKNSAITWEQFLAYMTQLGYSDADAALYGRIEGIAPAVAG